MASGYIQNNNIISSTFTYNLSNTTLPSDKKLLLTVPTSDINKPANANELISGYGVSPAPHADRFTDFFITGDYLRFTYFTNRDTGSVSVSNVNITLYWTIQ